MGLSCMDTYGHRQHGHYQCFPPMLVQLTRPAVRASACHFVPLCPCATATVIMCFSLLSLSHATSPWQFIFTALSDAGSSLPNMIKALLAAFDASKPYREIKLRGGSARLELGLTAMQVVARAANGLEQLLFRSS